MTEERFVMVLNSATRWPGWRSQQQLRLKLHLKLCLKLLVHLPLRLIQAIMTGALCR